MDATPPPRPYFFPPDLSLDDLPESIRVPVEGLVQSAYKELVLEAPNALERSAGATFVFLILMELLEQIEIGREVGATLQERGSGALPRTEALQRCLRVISAKEKAGSFLLRVRALRSRCASDNPFAG